MQRRSPAQNRRAKPPPRGERASRIEVRSRFEAASVYAYAADFLQAAKSIRSANRSFRPARLYLVCHSLELGLRAFVSLSARSLDDTGRRASGHDLTRLLSKAQSLGLDRLIRFRVKEVNEIRKASLYYERKVFEYPALAEALRGYPKRPNFKALLTAAEELIAAIREPCLAHG
jgi:hypothetical protein